MSPEVAATIERGPPLQAWRRFGVARLGGLLAVPTMRRLERFVAAAYDAVAREIDRASPTDPELRDSFIKWRGIPVNTLPRFLRRYEAELAGELRDLAQEVDAAVGSALGIRGWPRWRPLPAASYLRRHVDASAYVPWHIDADAAGTALVSAACFNVWVPLEAVGNGSPSLQLIPGSHRQMRDMPLLRDTAWPYRSDDWVGQNIAGEPWTPTLAPGDALLFDQYVLHRTQSDGLSRTGRTSCEFRFVNMPPSLPAIVRSTLKRRVSRAATALASRLR